MANGREFKAKLGAWAAKAGEQLDGLARQSIQQMCFQVVADTPVDTGFLRSSWQPSLGTPKAGAGQEFGMGGSGASAAAAKALASIGVTITDMKLGEKFVLSNNANYALHVEFGTTKMNGRFMVTDNAKRWPQIVSKTANELGIK
jgi:hypothetical protein